MITLSQGGAYLVNGTEVIPEGADAAAQMKSKTGQEVSKQEAAKNTIAYGILAQHNTSGNMDKLKIKFDKLTSHDITFVGIIQTARASGLTKFPIPMYSPIATILCVQWAVRSMRTIICLA